MNVIKKVTDNAKKAAFKHAINGLNMASDENIVKVMDALLWLMPDDYEWLIKSVKKSVKDRDAFFVFLRRFLNETNPNCRDKFLVNFAAQGVFINNDIKKKLRAEGKTSPTTVLISPSMRCNLDCVGCYAGRYSKKDDMDPKLFDRILTESEEAGVPFFTILGGEPLIYKDLLPMFKKHKDSFFQFYTNSTLLTEDVVKELAKLGNAIPMISIEGWEEQTDARRGKGTYKKILKAMALLKKERIPFGVSVAVTSKNVDIVSSDEFIQFLVDQGAFLAWWFLYMPIGKEPDLSLMPTPKQRRMMYERGKEIRSKFPFFLIDFWNDAPYVGGCIAGKEYIHINTKGDVEPCIFTHFAADNIKDKSLLEVMNSDYFKALRSRQPYNDNLFMPCMWIDNPEVARELHKKYGVYPTHPDAEFIIDDPKTKKAIDKYAKEIAKEFEEPWHAQHCKNCQHKCK